MKSLLTDKSIDLIVHLRELLPGAPDCDIIEAALDKFNNSYVPRQKRPEVAPGRAELFQKMYDEGMTLQEIATGQGLTRERVRQILEKGGAYKKHKKIVLTKEEKKTRRKEKAIQSFLLKVNKSDAAGCWPWTGCANKKSGYGVVGIKELGDPRYAHRAAYIIANGSIPNGLQVLHSCNNPICCNPSHLYAGTPLQNMADREKRYQNGELKRRPRKATTTAADVPVVYEQKGE